ncbi:hypothetical protein [Mangrovitalea sediminis]|uniref:hypothetical protein n=1 Tax=Mangrovitalea sediminis TaxID=1982043 RepID=UPI00117831FD|nr:hypothetical protein [Mangrovitalea sediminis]
MSSRSDRNCHLADIDSLGLWRCVTRKHSLLSSLQDQTRHSSETPARNTLLEANPHQGTVALALEFPFKTMPVCTETNSEAAGNAIRRYLDNLLDEARRVGELLQDGPAVSHLYLLGNVAGWLDAAELTEVMFRLGRYFHVRQSQGHCAVLAVDDWNQDKGAYNLIRGLGFTHLLINSTLPLQGSADSERFAALRQHWDKLGLTPIVPVVDDTGVHAFQRIGERDTAMAGIGENIEAVVDAAPDRLIGLGLGAWSVLGHQLLRNPTQLNHYYGSLSERRLDGQAANRNRVLKTREGSSL